MKKRNPIDRMKDPFYARLLFQIERMICLADDEAKDAGVNLTDSHIRSALIKAKKLVQGEEPEVPQETDRDGILSQLIMSLYHAPDDILEERIHADGTREKQPLQVSHWIRAIETVMDSMKTWKGGQGSRGYLDFLHRFLADAQ